MGANYVPLSRLVEEWAAQGGELPATVLTNLCAHEGRRRLPTEAFRHARSGEPLPRGALSELVGLARSAGYRVVQEDAARALDAIVVSKAHLLGFCRANAIRPPRCVAGFRGWLMWCDARHRSPPPPQPTADELEQREAARAAADAARNDELTYEAEAIMDLLRSMLARWSGENPSLGAPSGVLASPTAAPAGPDESTALQRFPGEQFDRFVSHARHYIEQLTDADRAAELRGRLQELEAEGAAVQEKLQTRTPVENPEPTVAAAQTQTTIAAETRCQLWLADMMHRGLPMKTKADYRAEAQQQFPGLSARGFMRCWDAAINETGNTNWRKPGRRS